MSRFTGAKNFTVPLNVWSDSPALTTLKSQRRSHKIFLEFKYEKRNLRFGIDVLVRVDATDYTYEG